jgi:hypothetical protein
LEEGPFPAKGLQSRQPFHLVKGQEFHGSFGEFAWQNRDSPFQDGPTKKGGKAMDGMTPTARWTITQPWRGIFGLVITLGSAMIITSIFDLQTYLGTFTTFIMSNVPILALIGAGWQAQYPSTEGLTQPWRGFLLTAFSVFIGLLACFGLVDFIADGAATPFIHVQAINTVITIFFLLIAFGMWPFQKMSLPGKGFWTLILAYVLAWLITKIFFNFSMLSYAAPTGPVPFYAKGGPLAAFAGIAPMGAFAWECALAFYFAVLLFLFCFLALGFWPFSKSPSLMKQPVMGIVVTIVCIVLGAILYLIGVQALNIEPLKFLLYLVSFLFGLLMFIFMFQMWPGRTLKSPVGGGILNIILSIIVGIIAYYTLGAWCISHFGADAMKYPFDIFAKANLMLGLTFPAWAAYSALWDFWPLPPTPPPPAPPG